MSRCWRDSWGSHHPRITAEVTANTSVIVGSAKLPLLLNRRQGDGRKIANRLLNNAHEHELEGETRCKRIEGETEILSNVLACKTRYISPPPFCHLFSCCFVPCCALFACSAPTRVEYSSTLLLFEYRSVKQPETRQHPNLGFVGKLWRSRGLSFVIVSQCES